MGWIVVAAMLVAPTGAGPEIELMVLTEVRADRAKVGDPVKLMLNQPLTVDGAVIARPGARAAGEVVSVEPSGPGLKRGSLAIRITRLEAEGRTLALAGELDTRGRGGKNDDALKLLLVPYYAPFARGNSAKFKAGELIRARLAAPVAAAP